MYNFYHYDARRSTKVVFYDKIIVDIHPTFIYLISTTKDESLRNVLFHILPSKPYHFFENIPYPTNAARYPFSFVCQIMYHLKAAARNQWEVYLIYRTNWVALRYIIELFLYFWSRKVVDLLELFHKIIIIINSTTITVLFPKTAL